MTTANGSQVAVASTTRQTGKPGPSGHRKTTTPIVSQRPYYWSRNSPKAIFPVSLKRWSLPMKSTRRSKRRRPRATPNDECALPAQAKQFRDQIARRPASLLQAVIRRLRRDGAGHRAVNRVPPNTLKGIFHDFAAAVTRVIHAGEKINRAHRLVGELEDRVNEVVVLEGRRDVTAIYQFTFFERAVVKSVAAQFNALVPKGLTLVVVVFHA